MGQFWDIVHNCNKRLFICRIRQLQRQLKQLQYAHNIKQPNKRQKTNTIMNIFQVTKWMHSSTTEHSITWQRTFQRASYWHPKAGKRISKNYTPFTRFTIHEKMHVHITGPELLSQHKTNIKSLLIDVP